MNNEIGRKITSLTLMTIMLAGGMTFAAPSMMPVAFAANANLFVSAENSQFDNYMSGPQVIEVVVIDSNINDTDQGKGEPDVTVNGKKLRMAQAVDGNWYGYFADRTQAIAADATTSTAGVGLDFGSICTADQAEALLFNAPTGTEFGQTTGVAIQSDNNCAAGTTPGSINVVREAKDLNANPITLENGQIDIVNNAWPFIQLYTLSPGGNVVVQYNKGGGAQSASLTFDTADQFASVALDRAVYPRGAQVHATITDLWLNIDPTDEDSWTFGTVGNVSTNYQVFDENGSAVGNVAANTDSNLLTSQLSALMCEDNCVMKFNADVQNKGIVATLQDNDDSVLVLNGNNPDVPTQWFVAGGFLNNTVPITITEQGPNSGVFGTYDESDTSALRITDSANRGTSASITYNDDSYTLLVGHSFAKIDIKPFDNEWNSGEEIPISLVDGDANRNSRADEDLDLNDPNTALIPSLRTGSPNTLSGPNQNTGFTAQLNNGTVLTQQTNVNLAGTTFQKFSDRGIINFGANTTIANGDTLALTFGTMGNVFDSTPIDDNDFNGFALFNYDIRSLNNENTLRVNNVDIRLAGVSLVNNTNSLQGLILLDRDDFRNLSSTTPLTATFTLNTGVSGGFVSNGVKLPVVADVFGFGYLNDGLEDNERFANQIIRLELEETGDNTSTFDGTLEYFMINQLTILDPSTYTGLATIDDGPTFIVIEDLDDEESPRVNYLDLGTDGVSTQVSDQQEAPSHSGVVSFDKSSYKNADTVTITLEDLDLNVDSDLIDIYTTVIDSANFPKLNDVVGSDAFNDVLSNGDNLGRLLDVTFDDKLWTTPKVGSACSNALLNITTDTGLGATGFTLIETTRNSGIFVGSFQIPAAWCESDTANAVSVTGLDIEVNYVDFRDASGETIEVGDSAGVRATTGSVSLDRTVYPVPFGVPDRFAPSTSTNPDGRSIFPVHQTAMGGVGIIGNTAGLDKGEYLDKGGLTVHVRVNDPDFDVSASGEDNIAQNRADQPLGPVKISVIRGASQVVLGYAGGPSVIPGPINVGNTIIGDGRVANGEITITSSTTGFGGALGSASAFTNGAVTITQGTNNVGATFTDNAANGIDSGSELSAFVNGGGSLATFVSGAITISQGPNTVVAIFTDAGAAGLGSGGEISSISSAGGVLVCQTGMPAANCATGVFTNVGNGVISVGELVVTNADSGMTPGLVTLVQGPNTATATWIDTNGDTNIDNVSGTNTELTITNGLASGPGFVDGTVTVTQPGTAAHPAPFVATFTFTDATTTLENGELTIVPSPSGSGFVNGGTVTITPVGVSNVSATGTFKDAPVARHFGPMTEIAPDAGIFEADIVIRYTDGPASSQCPDTTDYVPINGASAVGTNPFNDRFNIAPSVGDYCILQGDILQVEYTDPADASGDVNTVTDSATFDLRNGVLQSDKSVYIIGSDMILTLIEPDLDLDNDQAETYDLDLIEWDSDAATVTMGDADGQGGAFDPEPLNFRETGDSTGIFQIVIEIPQELDGDNLERGEEIVLEYTDWGPSGSDYVGDEDEDVNLTLFTSNFGATVELDQKVYTWTDKVYITIVAPDHNFDSNLIDEIGNTSKDPIKVSTRGFDINQYKLVETGTDTGIFTGEVILTGFEHDADGVTGSDTNPRTSADGAGPTDGFLETDDDDGLTVSFEFSEDETIVGSALIRWNIGEVQWLEASYPASGTGVVRVIDPDMNLDPESVDNFDVDAWSDSDAGGIDLTVTETNEATGIFEGTVFFTTTDESSGHRLRVSEGDTVTASYEDNTLPNPYTTADELDITATSLIGTIVPPLERAPAANLRVVDAFGNSLDTVSVDQQVQITADLANGQDREQQFAYLVQIQDGNGVTVSLAWITGSLSAGQSFSPALSWIPTEAGTYSATAFVWESVDNPTALSPPVSTTITVR
ncbi:MAG: hypothetical protein OEL56_06600 [Nitrosopumilus sp.]|nr:hypothetical protein [Nitrosopumilus sp.]